MVNKENMRKATEALRSEKYEQTFGALRNDAGFCALGVICDVSGVGRWVKYSEQAEDYYFVDITTKSENSSALTKGVIEWLGLEDWDTDIRLEANDGCTDVMDLNDTAEMDFHAIAALIEKEYEL